MHLKLTHQYLVCTRLLTGRWSDETSHSWSEFHNTQTTARTEVTTQSPADSHPRTATQEMVESDSRPTITTQAVKSSSACPRNTARAVKDLARGSNPGSSAEGLVHGANHNSVALGKINIEAS